MKTNSYIVAIILVLVASPSLGAQKPNISGNWVLDKDRSFSNPAGLEQTMTIVQSGDEVKLDAKVVVQQKETMVNETWVLDGKEREFSPSGAPQGATGKRKANWAPGNRALLVEDLTTTTTPNGPTVQRTTRKYSLSADGSTLIVDYFLDGPRGSFEAKRVFVRQK